MKSSISAFFIIFALYWTICTAQYYGGGYPGGYGSYGAGYGGGMGYGGGPMGK